MTIDNFQSSGTGGQNGQTKQNDHELVIFDFDETIVACNSDTFINVLAPNGKIPEEIWNRFLDERDWTAYMQQVFNYLHDHDVRDSNYEACLVDMPLMDGMVPLFQFIRDRISADGTKQFDAIIVSDANTFFIGNYLKAIGMDDVFR